MHHDINLLFYFCEHGLIGNNDMFEYMMCSVINRCLRSDQVYLRKTTYCSVICRETT